MAPKPAASFPSREEVVRYIRDSGASLAKRDLVRAFRISAEDRGRFRALLRDIEDAGEIERGRGRKLLAPDSLPPVTVVRVLEIDLDGEAIAVPDRWDDDAPPRIFMAPERRGGPALTVGQRALARIGKQADGSYAGRVMKLLDGDGTVRVVGVLSHGRAGLQFQPADKRQRDPLPVADADSAGGVAGDLVAAMLEPRGRFGPKRIRVTERLGRADDPKVIGLLALHGSGIPTEFPTAALAQAADAAFAVPKGYVDLRALPLVTIDGADARDFDDAVWAEPAEGGGWHLMVAIADVAHYVPAGSPLDREAFNRGNSVYLPDRVVPMLPEALSNGLCSLVPQEERLCLAAHLWIDPQGRLTRHRFVRGVMRSRARLTYEQVQAARDGAPDEHTEPLWDGVLQPLYGAFDALAAARAARGTLDLDLPERVVQLGPDGRVTGIGTRTRLDSHRLIEEFMIAANVAAAEALTTGRLACLFRVHDAPDRARLDAVRDFLAPLGYTLAKGQVIRPRAFTQILEQARGTAHAPIVNEMVLRAQAQAVYSPDNIGHFGLALPLYAHFTSPIRRYADLTVHRALIRVFDLGADGTRDEDLERLAAVGEHVSFAERRAATAEREATDRFTAAYLSAQIGRVLNGRITGVTRFGLFVRLAETGADGLVPVSTLPDDFYDHDQAAHTLIGRRWGRVFALGASVTTRLTEADPLTGSCLLHLLDAEQGAPGDMAPQPAATPDRSRPSRAGPPPRKGRRRRGER